MSLESDSLNKLRKIKNEISNLKTKIADKDARIVTLEKEKEDAENAIRDEKINLY